MISGIYAIVCKDTTIPEVYVGSTSNLEHRISEHKSDCCNKNRSQYNYKVYKFIRDNGGFYNWKFIVLEHYKGEREDLTQLERVWYETFPKDLLLNMNYPNRSKKEHYQKNKEQIKEYKQEYWEKNKEQIKEHKKQYYQKNKEQIKEHNKQYHEKNKEEISKKRSEKIPCPKCLKSISKRNISAHLKKNCPKNTI